MSKEPQKSDALSGRLIASQSSGWLLLEVPNAFLRGAFGALDVPGIELPLSDDGTLRAHILVMRKEEVDKIGGAATVSELGKHFRYQIGALHEVAPLGWREYEKVWFFRVESPELKQLRTSYGLSALPKKGDREMHFHITIARRKRGVLKPGRLSKKGEALCSYLLFEDPL